MSSQTQNSSVGISYQLANARLDALRRKEDAIRLKEMDKHDEDIFAKLEIAIEHALFLEEERKKIWKAGMRALDRKKAKELLEAILRENLRYKKGIRKLKFKKIPERVSEEARGDI